MCDTLKSFSTRKIKVVPVISTAISVRLLEFGDSAVVSLCADVNNETKAKAQLFSVWQQVKQREFGAIVGDYSTALVMSAAPTCFCRLGRAQGRRLRDFHSEGEVSRV